jgi:hypothetical protein
MVTIRDPKAVGKRIACPKCNDRFLVEAPGEETDGDEATAKPAAKTKPAANGNIKKPPAKDKAAVKTKPDAAEKSDTADKNGKDGKDKKEKPAKEKAKKTDSDKKKANTRVLVLGIVLGVVALGALGFGGWLLFGKSSNPQQQAQAPPQGGTPRPPSGGGPAMSNAAANPGGSGAGVRTMRPPTGTTGGATPPSSAPGGDKKPDKPKAADETKFAVKDITNLLPNDTKLVVSIPVDRLSRTDVGTAAIRRGAFVLTSFHQTFGFPLEQVSRILQASDPAKDWVFTVLRTNRPISKKDLSEFLLLDPQKAIKGLDWYLIQRPFDGLSNLLIKGNRQREQFALHIMDDQTLVFADVAPMTAFLEGERKPRELSPRPKPPAPGDPPIRRKRGAPGAKTGPGAPPPGGGATGARPPTAMQGGAPTPGGTPPAGMSGSGFPSPSAGMQGGTPPSGTKPTGPKPPPEIEIAAPYLTISPDLKSVLEEVEKDDDTILFTVAGEKSVLNHMVARRSTGAPTLRLPEVLREKALDTAADATVFAVAIKDFHENKLSLALALVMSSDDKASALETDLPATVKKVAEISRLDLGQIIPDGAQASASGAGTAQPGVFNPGVGPANPGVGNPQGPRPGSRLGAEGGRGASGGFNMGGGVGMAGAPPANFGGMVPPRGLMGGGNFMGVPPANAGGFQQPRPGDMVGGNFMGVPPVGNPAGGTPVPRPTDPSKGQDGFWSVWAKDDLVAINLTLKLKDLHKGMIGDLNRAMIWARGQADLADTRSRVHELAAAIQAYVSKNGHFPRAVVERKTDSRHILEWRPDERLSWFALLLPYVANGAYDRVELAPEKSWTEDKNFDASVIPVPQFLGTRLLKNAPPYVLYPGHYGIFAAAHYVGVSGVGYDAADYQNTGPFAGKRGVFGYDRVTRLQEITDGPENTIAVLMIPPASAGPWIAGGGSTVRGVSEADDCLEPFICYEHKGNDEHRGKKGALAIMCDGKVRFIPFDIDRAVFRAMCTISGGEAIHGLELKAPVIPPEAPPVVKSLPKPPKITEVPKAPPPEKPVEPTKPADPAKSPKGLPPKPAGGAGNAGGAGDS